MMHEIHTQVDNGKCSAARPSFQICPECVANKNYCKLKFNLISLSTGIWMCSNFKCNFPLNSERLESFIETIDVFHEKESNLKAHKNKGHSNNPYQDRKGKLMLKRCKLLETSGAGVKLKEARLGQINTQNKNSKRKKLLEMHKEQRYNGDDVLFDNVENDDEHTDVSYLLNRSCSQQNSLDTDKETLSQKRQAEKICNKDVDHDNLQSLQKYAPFMTKKYNCSSKDDCGFVLLESTVVTIENCPTNAKESDIEKCYENDSAYSSPTTDELNSMQNTMIEFGNNNHHPDFDSALEMIDSLFEDENKQENILNPLFFLDDNFDNFDTDIDVSKLC